MRRLLQRHRWATISVAVLLLFATSGMALSRMTCLMSGHSIVSFGMLEDCCPEPEPTEGPTVAAVCCEYAQTNLDVEPFMPTSITDQVPVPMALIGSAGELSFLAQALDVPAGSRYRAPPLPGNTRLALFATYRI